jgi:hypothetical protein
MCKTSFLWIAALTASALAAAERPGQIMSGSCELRGTVVRFTTVAEPPMKGDPVFPGGISGRPNRVHRFMVDSSTHQYFGYDLVVDPAGTPDRYQVTIEPLSLRGEELKLGRNVIATTPLLLPKYPPPQIVEDGDTIVLDLLVSPDGRQRVVDYIQVETLRDPRPAAATAEPRDFTLDDGPLSFEFRIPTKLLLNGQEFPGPHGMTGKPGATLWFSIPNRGRYILSLASRDGFVKAGAIRGNVIAFRDGTDVFELRTSGPIAGAGASWNLYLLHDSLFRAGNRPQFGTDRLDNLMPRPRD